MIGRASDSGAASTQGGAAARLATTGGVTDARAAAAAICADLRSGELLDASFDRRVGDEYHLNARDRRWTRELVYGMLRRRSRLDAFLNERVRNGIARLDADLLDLLRLGAFQLLQMGSVPAYAAIAQTVELAKRRHGMGASKLANARCLSVCRKECWRCERGHRPKAVTVGNPLTEHCAHRSSLRATLSYADQLPYRLPRAPY